MNTIYCIRNANNTLDFYARSKGGDCYLFTNRNYSSVYERYKNPVRIEDAMSFRKAQTKPLKRVARKLPMYLRYAEMYDSYISEKLPSGKIPERFASFSIVCEE